MAQVMRVTGAWTGLLRDWLDEEHFDALDLRSALARWSREDNVPVPVWRELIERGVALATGNPAAELSIGACVTPAHVGVLGYLVLASDTLGEAMLAYQRYERLFYGVSIAELEAIDDVIEIRWPPDSSGLGQLGDGVAIAALLTFLQRQMDKPPPISAVSFRGSVDALTASAYETFFGCPVTFEDTYVRVRFPQTYLSISMPRRDPTLRRLLDRQAQALLRALPGSSEVERILQQILLRLLADGEPTLNRAAKAMHMSPRTLQRRLSQHGLSWQQWLDRSREQLAEQYLADPGLSLSDIALLLGFSEQSAFTRAFRRWSGLSPGRFRRGGGEA
ncbi:helix-turn-helix domain-containing protein [Allohahella marinimesophila]|uniref:AraC family transcriptional regulator n=1 Tax=Allohahella marinimesophila TaxID=1054972 RepID=A0ABP7PI79_9GAMM